MKQNNKIWIYWHQGWGKAPELVIKCARSWEILNPEYTVFRLSKYDIDKFIDLDLFLDSSKRDKLSIVALSDIVRMLLLLKNGGIWVDSTLLCRSPLNSWLPGHFNEFFAFANPTKDKLISNWFLAAKKETYLINKWVEESKRYWNTWKIRRIYFWPHMIFKKCYQNDLEFRKKWDSVKKISADGPHYFAPFRQKFFKPLSQQAKEDIQKVQAPVFKLTYKCIQDGYPENSVISFVLNEYFDSLTNSDL